MFLIREAKVSDDPTAGSLQLSGRAELPDPRPRLPADPAMWPVGGGGVTQELRWDAGAASGLAWLLCVPTLLGLRASRASFVLDKPGSASAEAMVGMRLTVWHAVLALATAACDCSVLLGVP